ncbi:hypothetical protein ACFSSD_08470 [Sphingobacterium griseoflavum]
MNEQQAIKIDDFIGKHLLFKKDVDELLLSEMQMDVGQFSLIYKIWKRN